MKEQKWTENSLYKSSSQKWKLSLLQKGIVKLSVYFY